MKGAILLPQKKEKITLDRKNQVIVQELLNNARTSVTALARKTRLSKPAVLQRMHQLEKKGIILQYITYTNLKRAGYALYVLLFSTDKAGEQECVSALEKNKHTVAVLSLASTLNLAWAVFAKDAGHLSEMLETMDLKMKDMRSMQVTENCFENYILFGEQKNKALKTSQDKDVKLDRIDAAILYALKHDSRSSLVEIAHPAKVSSETVRQRMKRMESAGIILKYTANIDIFRLGFAPYMVLIKTNRSQQRRVLNFVRSHPLTNGQYLLDHDYDIMCFLVIDDLTELREFTEQLYQIFKGSILGHEAHLILNQFSNDFFPEGVREGYKNP